MTKGRRYERRVSTRTAGWWAKRALVVLLLALMVGLGAGLVWANDAAAPEPAALAALASDGSVTVEQGPWLVFTPTGQQPTAGLIVYPGGRVDPRAYAPVARAVAGEGFLVAIVPMPLNLAVIAPDRASEVIAAYPDIKQWAIGGHSLGGAMAARFAHGHPQAVSGLVFWAAYPDASDDLSGRQLAVTSIYGTHDGLATGEKIDASRALLPPDTRWVAIEGGNHAQFGSYGPQAGDGEATISAEAQQARAMAATVDLLRQIPTEAP
ncbi:MAG: alpha/beta hydrolase [Chloroflexota bacterium]